MVVLDGVVLLAAFTARSQAYVQALAHAGLQPEMVILFGSEKAPPPGEGLARNRVAVPGLFLPSLDISLPQTIKKHHWNYEELFATDVNDSVILDTVRKHKPKLIVYSGYGAQLVRKDLLQNGAPLLHIHSGWLPQYRGSTTLYYSWLRENRCGASAIFLEEGIDTGPVLAKRHYPPPPPGVDPDYLYDTAIRADLLIAVLRDYRSKGLLLPKAQETVGNTYYVIHPVLKHLALLRNE